MKMNGEFKGHGKIFNQKLSEDIKKEVYAVLAKATSMVKEKALELCPVRTGALKGSIAERIVK